MNIVIPYCTKVSSFDIIASHLGQSDKYFTSFPKIMSIYSTPCLNRSGPVACCHSQ